MVGDNYSTRDVLLTSLLNRSCNKAKGFYSKMPAPDTTQRRGKSRCRELLQACGPWSVSGLSHDLSTRTVNCPWFTDVTWTVLKTSSATDRLTKESVAYFLIKPERWGFLEPSTCYCMASVVAR